MIPQSRIFSALWVKDDVWYQLGSLKSRRRDDGVRIVKDVLQATPVKTKGERKQEWVVRDLVQVQAL